MEELFFAARENCSEVQSEAGDSLSIVITFVIWIRCDIAGTIGHVLQVSPDEVIK